jgi:8-oxo-dGTP pyrophosphatase MutT (NUDIX family)
MQFTSFTKNTTKFTFIPASSTPQNLPITAIANIAQLDSYYVLIADKNSLTNFIFGHIEDGESLEVALIRESKEEAGINIERLTQIGYILCENQVTTATKYPNVSAINVYHSYVTKSFSDWEMLETSDRFLISYKKAKKLLGQRPDNNQLSEILEYTHETNKSLIAKVDFTFNGQNYIETIPVSQVFNFVSDDENMFCVVRDYDENHWSLPGGGCDLGENFENCAFRETAEEAQIETDNFKIIGVFNLKYLDKNNTVIHQTQHIRVASKAKTIHQFQPQKDGFETIERKFVHKSELIHYVDWLKYEGGKEMLELI